MVPFALPVVACAQFAGADWRDLNVQLRVERWTASAVASIALTIFFLIALHLATPEGAWITTMLLATGSAMFSTVGQGLWQHGGVIVWGLAALLVEFHTWKQPTLQGALFKGLCCAMMVACRLASVTFIAPFFFWQVVRSPRVAVGVAAFAGLSYIPWAALYLSIYGNIFGPSVTFVALAPWTSAILDPLLGVLVSPARGLLVYQPWILLASLALIPSIRRGLAVPAGSRDYPPGWAWFCISAVVLQLLLISVWRLWWGGWCWGSRLAAEIIPLCALLCLRPIAWLWVRQMGRCLVLAVALLSVCMHVPAVCLRSDAWNAEPNIDYSRERLWSWSDPPFLYPLLKS
jgi:hypothetical protein